MTYTNTTGAAQTLNVMLLTDEAGVTYLDCVQAEKAATPSRYNILSDGDFGYSGTPAYGWGRTTPASATRVNVPDTAAPHLNGSAVEVVGTHDQQRRVWQDVAVSGSAGDSFVLAGWAKGCSVPLDPEAEDYPSDFAIRATFTYTDGTTSEATRNIAHFNPWVDSTWVIAVLFIAMQLTH